MTVAETTRHYRALRKLKGQCWFCTEPISPRSEGMCDRHLLYQRDYYRARKRVTPQSGVWKLGGRGRPPLWAKEIA